MPNISNNYQTIQLGFIMEKPVSAYYDSCTMIMITAFWRDFKEICSSLDKMKKLLYQVVINQLVKHSYFNSVTKQLLIYIQTFLSHVVD